jgi:hypothetical protein
MERGRTGEGWGRWEVGSVEYEGCRCCCFYARAEGRDAGVIGRRGGEGEGRDSN